MGDDYRTIKAKHCTSIEGCSTIASTEGRMIACHSDLIMIPFKE
jgi:hypothetical protein